MWLIHSTKTSASTTFLVRKKVSACFLHYFPLCRKVVFKNLTYGGILWKYDVSYLIHLVEAVTRRRKVWPSFHCTKNEVFHYGFLHFLCSVRKYNPNCYICITLNSRLALIIFKRLMQQHFEIFAVINNHKSLEIYIPILESKHKNYYSTEQNKSSNTPFRKTTHTAVVSV